MSREDTPISAVVIGCVCLVCLSVCLNVTGVESRDWVTGLGHGVSRGSGYLLRVSPFGLVELQLQVDELCNLCLPRSPIQVILVQS
jgi:hypothetical protein